MKRFRLVCIATVAALVAACSAAPNKTQVPPVINVAGNWLVHLATPMGAYDMNMTLAQTGKSFTGSLDSVDKKIGIHVDCTGSVEGNEIRLGYLYVPQGVEMRVTFFGTVAGNTMTGRIRTSTPVGDAPESTFAAERR